MRGRSAPALAAGLGVGVLYAASAALSGHLSPLARQPLLDGLAPAVPYRWVEPPPELAATNLEPASGRFEIDLTENGSASNVVTTGDAQVALILSEGAFPTADGQRAVAISVDPLAPSAVQPPRGPTTIVGNVYLLDATYQPSGRRARLRGDLRVVLVYPLVTGIHGHTLIVSEGGEEWTEVESTDFTAIQQVDGPVGGLGYVAVGSAPAPSPATGPTATPSRVDDGPDIATIAIATGIVLLSGVAAYLVFSPSGRASRRPRGSATGSRPENRSSSRSPSSRRG